MQKSIGRITSIAIIDSRPIFTKGLKTTLESIEPSVSIVEANYYNELQENFESKTADILFLGAGNLSDNELLSQINKLRDRNKSCKIAMYDYRNSWGSLLQFFREKVSGYLKENFDVQDLKECLDYLETDRMYLDSEIVSHLINAGLGAPAKTKKLSKMENVVAEYLISGMSVSKIAQKMDRQISTISTVKAKIQKKLNVDNVIDLAKAMGKQ